MHAIRHSLEQPYSPFIQASAKVDFSHLMIEWNRNISEYQKLVKLAFEKQVDIRSQTECVQKVIKNMPVHTESHQFLPIRVLSEIKMYGKYNKEIAREIAKNGLYHENQETLLDKLNELAAEVNSNFQKWVQIAQDKNIDISQQIHQMQQVMNNQPSSDDPHQFSSIRLLHEMQMRKIYCIQIIRKIAEEEIRRMAQIGRSLPKLKNQEHLITQCENFLLGHLPPVNGKIVPQLSVGYAEQKYFFIMEKMENMKEVFLEKLEKKRF